MSALDTVRVANPAAPHGFMTINRADYRSDAHELWAEQADGFEPFPVPSLVSRLDPAERDLAAMLMIAACAAKAGETVEAWLVRPVEERMAVLREAEASLVERQAPPPDFAVAKGPRGLWYLKRGAETVGRGYESETAARAELARLQAA